MKNLANDIKSTALLSSQSGIWYLGQEGFLIKNDDLYIVVDPYLTDYVDRNCSKLVKWERLYPAPMKAEELNFVDIVICTHSHYDHADPETLSAIAKANPKTKFIIPAPECENIASYGIESERIIPAKADEVLSFGKTKIMPIPSAHEEFHTDENGNYCELGYIIENESGRFFHAGDMCMYDGLVERLQNIDIAFLPINGRDYFRNANNIIGNFTCEEAVLLSKACGADMLVPMHYDLYEVNRVSTSVFSNVVERLNPMQKYHYFVPAEKYIFSK